MQKLTVTVYVYLLNPLGGQTWLPVTVQQGTAWEVEDRAACEAEKTTDLRVDWVSWYRPTSTPQALVDSMARPSADELDREVWAGLTGAVINPEDLRD